MRYGSVCSGVEAATVAWHPLGWQAAWYSEIEPFPSAVLKHHYPTVPNYGDMTQYEAWPDEPINLLVGGTPCQSFSVAGLRKGLADPRGNLMLTYGAIAKRYRPEWLVWENVPGVLSSNGGRDFGTFLGMLAELGYGFAYRVLDAQYFGVAQRRRRVFVVGHLGNWQRAAAVLFERHSLQGHLAPSRETRQDAAKCLTASLGMRLDPTSETFPIAPTLQAHDGAKWGSNQWVDEGKAIVERVAETLMASDHKGPGHNRDHNFVAQPVPYDFFQITAPVNRQSREPGDPCHTLARDNAAHATIVQPTYGIPGNWIGRQPENGGNAVEPMHDVSPCLTKTDRHGVAQPTASAETAGTLRANAGSGFRSNGTPVEGVAIQAMQVRRLTPVECERLQGFPDNYTNIPWRNKAEAPDGPRYKAMGNSMAVPVMRWIGERIAAVEAL
jgi:DNA (cytosine-5)-methyltransferase 1